MQWQLYLRRKAAENMSECVCVCVREREREREREEIGGALLVMYFKKEEKDINMNS